MKKTFFCSLFFLLAAKSILASGVAFAPEKEGKNLLVEKLVGAVKEPFQMGWVLPPDRLILDGKFDVVQIVSSSPELLTAKFEKPLSPAEIATERQNHCVACEDTVAYYQYRVTRGQIRDRERVFVSSIDIPNIVVGWKPAFRTKFLTKKDAGILGIKPGQLHKSLYWQTPDGKFVYSFHAFYDPKSKELKREGMMLEKRGVLIGTETYNFDPDNTCDGCGTPVFSEPLQEVYAPINLIQTSALPCPILLIDTSTVEGRALSLQTFDLDGNFSEMRSYEYTVNCCH